MWCWCWAEDKLSTRIKMVSPTVHCFSHDLESGDPAVQVFFLHRFKVFVCLGCQMKSLCLRCGTACSRWRSKTWESTARRESRSQPKWESSSTNEHTDFVCFHFFTSCFSAHIWICFYATVIASFLLLWKSQLKKDYGRMPERTHKHTGESGDSMVVSTMAS